MESNEESEAFLTISEDIFLNVSTFGLHNPQNLHAFTRKTYVSFLPTSCTMCNGTIFPFTVTAHCLNCLCTVHRCCANVDKYLCPKFGFRNGSKDKNRSVLSGKESKITLAHSGQLIDFTIIYEYYLRQFADFVPVKNPFDLGDTERLECLCLSMLKNPQSFPGHLAVICRSVFMNLKFIDPKDVPKYARRCLDTVSSSLVFELEKKYAISVPLYKIVNIVDKTLLELASTAMYKKIMSSIESDDHIRSLEENLAISNSETAQVVFPSAILPLLDARVLTRLVSALEKCQFFLELLKNCVSLLLHKDESDNVSADEIIPQVALYIQNSLRCGVQVNWHAQCKFVTSMCCASEQWLLGEEGYALTTVMQALKFILGERYLASRPSSSSNKDFL